MVALKKRLDSIYILPLMAYLITLIYTLYIYIHIMLSGRAKDISQASLIITLF